MASKPFFCRWSTPKADRYSGLMAEETAAGSGYLYAVTGEPHRREAIASATQLRAVAPKASITLVCDGADLAEKLGDQNPFSEIRYRAPAPPITDNPMTEGFRYVIETLAEGLPYARTVFLDSDTWAASNPAALFAVARFTDVAAVLEPNAHFEGSVVADDRPIHAAPRYNTGVILLTRRPIVEAMLADWRERFTTRFTEGTHGFETDQRTFAEAALASRARVLPLENNWNFRTPFYMTVSGAVRILHGRHVDPAAAAATLNASNLNRVWDPFTHEVSLLDPERVVEHGFHLPAS